MYIYRTWITTKDGSKIYAKDYGKKAFRIWVGPDPEPVKSNQLTSEALCRLKVSLLHCYRKAENKMAKTKSSTRGVQNKKIVVVKPYTKSDGTKVGGHRRSTPN